MDDQLAERLTALRAEDLSYEQIAKVLYSEGGVETSAETLRSWARQLGIEPVTQEAS